jgi:hypothetical protein
MKGIQHTIKIGRALGLKFELLNQPLALCDSAAVESGFIRELKAILRAIIAPPSADRVAAM